MNKTVELFDQTIMSAEPVAALMSKAGNFATEENLDMLHNVDGLLAGILIKALRRGDRTNMDDLAEHVVDFLESPSAAALKKTEEGRTLCNRWEYLFDLVGLALDNYDPMRAGDLIHARTQGPALFAALYRKPVGWRAGELASELGISAQNLAKLLRFYEQNELIERSRHSKATIVRLSLLGQTHMDEQAPKKEVDPIDQTPKFKWNRDGVSDEEQRWSKAMAQHAKGRPMNLMLPAI